MTSDGLAITHPGLSNAHNHRSPHADLRPHGATFDVRPGARLRDLLREHGVAIEQAREKACVCTTCHALIRRGFESLAPASDDEEDQPGKAWGLEPTSRLSCQAKMARGDLVIEIPRYSLNLAHETHA